MSDNIKYNRTVPRYVKKAVFLPPEAFRPVSRKKKVCKITKGEHQYVWTKDRKMKGRYIEQCACGKTGDWFWEGESYCRCCHCSLAFYRNGEKECWNNCFKYLP